jgi:hypothetical protein
MHDYLKLNNFIEQGINKYDITLLETHINECVNLLMLDKNTELKLNDPFDDPFNKFTINVDNLLCQIPDNSINMRYVKGKYKTVNFTKNQILFIHNDTSYYGDRDTVYESIIMLKQLNDIFVNNIVNIDVSDAITIMSPASQHVMNLYINSCYGNGLDMNDISPEEFVDFLNLIDKYPTDILSIDLLENQLIYYTNKYDILMNNDINALIIKYQLKHMYLSVHQKYTFKHD